MVAAVEAEAVRSALILARLAALVALAWQMPLQVRL
jgi:hypothetical protein